MYEDDVRGRLERTVLEAFAYDVPVVGRHVLSHEDRGVPDVVVSIRTDDVNSIDPSVDRETPHRSEAFEAALHDLLLTAYAETELADPVGTWNLSFPSPHVPDWTVEVSLRMLNRE